MVEGIDILNKTEIMYNPFWVPLLWIAGLSVLLIGLIFLANSYNRYLLGIIGGFLMIIGAIALVAGLLGSNTESTGIYQYEATVDDSVSFNDLQKRYDVVNQNGRIWTLKDKEKES